MCVFVRACVHVCMCACVRACVRVRMYMCVMCVHVCVCMCVLGGIDASLRIRPEVKFVTL